MIDERWEVPNGKCDLCKCIKPPDENWWEEHATAGGSGFNFTFCFECDKNRRGECDKVMCECFWHVSLVKNRLLFAVLSP